MKVEPVDVDQLFRQAAFKHAVEHPRMKLHPECEHACQQAQDYGVWPEHHCSPKCVYLGALLRDRDTIDKAKLPDKP